MLYKHAGFNGSPAPYLAHLRSLARALDQHLPCKSFYNYAELGLPCAGSSDDGWLAAHVSDVARVRAIQADEDPAGRFRVPSKNR